MDLLGAIAANSIEDVEYLLQLDDVDVNEADEDTLVTPLMECASLGSKSILKLLLAKGAVISAVDVEGHLALHHAVSNKHKGCVEVLLEHHSPLEVRNRNGYSPMDIAALYGYDKIACSLKRHGAGRIQPYDLPPHRTSLEIACSEGHMGVVKVLLNALNPAQDWSQYLSRALKAALPRGHFEIIEELVFRGAPFKISSGSDISVINQAASYGYARIVNLLITRGADIEEVDDEGFTPLMRAVECGNEDVIDILVSAGADPMAVNKVRRTNALMLAKAKGRESIQKMILSASELALR